MSKIIKGVLVYTIIIAGIAFVLGIIAFGAMYLTANSEKPFSLFGYNGIAVTNKKHQALGVVTTSEGGYEIGDHVRLIINNGNFNLNVSNHADGTTSNIIVTKYDTITGISKGAYDGQVTLTHNAENKTVTIDVPQLDGWAIMGNSYVDVKLPSSRDFIYDLVINSGSARVNVDGKLQGRNGDQIVTSSELKIAELKANSTSGVFKFSNLKYIDGQGDNQKTHMLSASMKTSSGLFDFSAIENLKIQKVQSVVEKIVSQRAEIENDEFTAYSLLIEQSGGEYVFENLKAKVNMTGNNLVIRANTIDTLKQGFRYESQKGYFAIQNIYSEPQDGITGGEILNYIETHNIAVNIAEITGPTEIVTNIGSVKIGKARHGLAITTKTGDITVSTAIDAINLTSEKGDISVAEFRNSAVLKTSNGSISATQKLMETNDALAKLIRINVQTESGKITLRDIESSTKTIVTKSSNAVMYIAKSHLGRDITHEVDFKNGTLEVHTDRYVGFNLQVFEGGNARGQLGATVIADEISGKAGTVVPILGGASNAPTYLVTKGTVVFVELPVEGDVDTDLNFEDDELNAVQSGGQPLNIILSN